MKARGISGMIELEVENLPDDLIIEAKLDIDLPQDMMSQANIAGMITGQGLASKQWVQENILNIGQPEDMQKQIWNEQASQALYQQQVQSWMQQQQMMQQQAMMAGQAPPMPQSGPPMPQEGPPMTPQGPGMQAQAGMVSSGRPGTQPIPPSAEAGGMQEGEVPL
jgi:hypothetical protein